MSKQNPDTSSSSQTSESFILTPSGTPPQESPSNRSSPKHMSSLRTDIGSSTNGNTNDGNTKMDEKSNEQTATSATERQDPEEVNASKSEDKLQNDTPNATAVKKKTSKCQNSSHKKKSKTVRKSRDKRKVKDDSDSDSSSDEQAESDDESSDESSSSEEEPKKKKKSAKTKKLTKKSKDKKRRKSKKQESEDEEESSESEASEASSEEEPPKKKKSKKSKSNDSESEEKDSSDDDDEEMSTIKSQLKDLMSKLADMKGSKTPASKRRRSNASKSSKTKSKSKKGVNDALDYKRVDQLWDGDTHQFQLKESAEEDDKEFAEFAFLVRRRFDWENKYLSTVVDIKSKQLRAALQEVMKGCKSVSLEAMEPCIDPNLLFLYLEELRTYYKKTLKAKIKAEKKKKVIKKLEVQRSLTKTLVKYLDEDYADTKKTLLPLLAAGNITFDLLWALFRPNDIAITSCYGSWDNPRCFKVDYAHKYQTLSRGEFYAIEGRYLEYDGKSFGFGDQEVEIDKFQGPRKITSLNVYPLKYHKDAEGMKKLIIERGQKFVSMEGMQYKFHKGLAFMKKKKQVLRININGRVMVDPATFRRINPNYPISMIKPKDDQELDDGSGDEGGCSCCDANSDDEDAVADADEALDRADNDDEDHDSESKPKFKYKWVENDDGDSEYVAVEVDDNGDPIQHENLDRLDNPRTFTEEQLLLTSPVVVGFAFSEKLWLEFTISGIHDVDYNDQAFDQLVLPQDQKSTVRALVESHKFHAAKAIDDVVVGKGQGCVIVLHGKPGVGKTLTAEAISELTKSPLYTISAGELGTDPARLESELEKILSIAHSWGAVLLLDEADVFLEKREVQDVHRNALVSVFLRQLEYCQNLLVLTTNRVETFDEAFHSRIHLALRYGDLTAKAKKAIWRMFLDKVRGVEGVEVAEFSEADLDALARHALNGRQIKNVVKTAQALSLHENRMLTLEHIKRVLDVAETFDRDLRGGTGYIDAMRSYT